MNIYPALDILNGNCVRLYQGNFENETIYNLDPKVVIKDFESQGATWLHLVDLNGAKDPINNQAEIIMKLASYSSMKLQIGGGIRTREQIKLFLDHGIERVIVGKLAVTQPDTVVSWLSEFGAEKIILALDYQINKIGIPCLAIDAWQKISEVKLYELVEFFLNFNLKHVLCTNVSLDGTLQGPDFAFYKSFISQYPDLFVQASGGIRSIDDIKVLKEMGLSGVIVGRALYENKCNLNEVMRC